MRLCPLAADGTVDTKTEPGLFSHNGLGSFISHPFRQHPHQRHRSPPCPTSTSTPTCSIASGSSCLKQKGVPRYSIEPLSDKVEEIYKHGAHFMTPMPGHLD